MTPPYTPYGSVNLFRAESVFTSLSHTILTAAQGLKLQNL